MLLKNNTCCFCCQKLLILSITQKNQRYKWKLSWKIMGGHNLLPICCHRGPPPICCQLVISLKSYPWQHIWSSKSFLTFYRKIAHFGSTRNFSSRKLFFSRIIGECPRCYKWCRKQHSIIVAGFQQNCCFSATNVDFSAFSSFIHAQI